MNIEIAAPATTSEGTALPPPRPFGETGTITVPRGARAARGRSSVAHVIEPTETGQQVQARAAVVPADAAPLTVTF